MSPTDEMVLLRQDNEQLLKRVKELEDFTEEYAMKKDQEVEKLQEILKTSDQSERIEMLKHENANLISKIEEL